MPIQMPKPAGNVPMESVERSESDRLAIALCSIGVAVAIAAVFVGLFLDQPVVLILLICAFAGAFVYPILHFFKRTRLRIAAFVIVGLITLGTGFMVWKLKKPVQGPADSATAVVVHDNAQWESQDDTIIGTDRGLRIEGNGKVDSQNLSIITPGANIRPQKEEIDAFLAEAKKLKPSEVQDWSSRVARYLRLHNVPAPIFVMPSTFEDKKRALRELRKTIN